MLNKNLAITLCVLLVIPAMAAANPPDTAPQPQITSLTKGAPAPYSGVLLNTVAAAKMFTERDFFNEECAHKISYAVEKESLRLKLLLDSSRASMETLDQKYTSLLEIKDKEIERLGTVASNTNDYSSWWFAGGIVAGIITSVVIVYAVNSVE